MQVDEQEDTSLLDLPIPNTFLGMDIQFQDSILIMISPYLQIV